MKMSRNRDLWGGTRGGLVAAVAGGVPASVRKSIVTAALMALLAGPSAAHGAEVAVLTEPEYGRISPQYLTYTGAPGEQNRVTIDVISEKQRKFRVVDKGANLTNGRGCTRVSDHEATCRGPDYAYIEAGDGNDLVRMRAPLSSTVYAGPGDDTVVTAGGADALDGGGGNDVLHAGGGNDLVTDGDNAMTGVGPDTLDGGTGAFDRVDYGLRDGPVSVDLSARGPQGEPGEDDVLTGFEAAEVRSAADRLIGDSGANLLQSSGTHGVVRGRGGNDDLEAQSGGRDILSGGSGNDHLSLARSSGVVPDKISCGSGRDRVSFPSAQQYVPPDCEIVDYDTSIFAPVYYLHAWLATSSSPIVKIVSRRCEQTEVRNGRCHVTWAIREEAKDGATRGPLLARQDQTFPQGAGGSVVRLRLTPAGRSILRRRQDLYARIGKLRRRGITGGFVMRLQLATDGGFLQAARL